MVSQYHRHKIPQVGKVLCKEQQFHTIGKEHAIGSTSTDSRIPVSNPIVASSDS
ncbi:MAG: hypothetical protein ACW99A_04590 [Candidatus Kariarchaeaceae archaeon]